MPAPSIAGQGCCTIRTGLSPASPQLCPCISRLLRPAPSPCQHVLVGAQAARRHIPLIRAMHNSCQGSAVQVQRRGHGAKLHDVQAVIKGLPWFGDGAAGSSLAHKACQPDDQPVSGWELNTALEAIDIMLTPLLARAEEGSNDAEEMCTSRGMVACIP